MKAETDTRQREKQRRAAEKEEHKVSIVRSCACTHIRGCGWLVMCVVDADAALSLDVFSVEAVPTKTLLAALLTYWHQPARRQARREEKAKQREKRHAAGDTGGADTGTGTGAGALDDDDGDEEVSAPSVAAVLFSGR